MRVKGIHEIKTHLTLARQNNLVSVARDWHKLGSGSANTETSDWNLKKHVFNKYNSNGKQPPPAPLKISINIRKKIREYQIQTIENSIKELNEAAVEGLSINADELKRLTEKLAKLKSSR